MGKLHVAMVAAIIWGFFFYFPYLSYVSGIIIFYVIYLVVVASIKLDKELRKKG